MAGIDGCSAPNYALPLSALARAFARLATGDDDGRWNGAPRVLRDAMIARPAMVSGEGRSDEALMLAGAGDWVAKIGAEGVQAVGVTSRGWGIAIKVADGARRAIGPATVAVLDQLGLLDDARRAALARLARAHAAQLPRHRDRRAAPARPPGPMLSRLPVVRATRGRGRFAAPKLAIIRANPRAYGELRGFPVVFACSRAPRAAGYRRPAGIRAAPLARRPAGQQRTTRD